MAQSIDVEKAHRFTPQLRHHRPAVLPAWLSCPLPAAFSGSPTGGVIAGYPMQTVMRFSRSNGQNGNKKAVTKQTSPAFAFSGRSC